MDVGLIFILFLLGTAMVALVVGAVAAALGARAVSRRNRVSPSTPTDAPLTWMGAPHAGGRLHRRLRTAVRVARRSADSAPAAAHLEELAAELEREAVTLDTHIVIASRMAGAEGRARMRALAVQVRKVEQLASQLSLLSAQAQAPLVAGGHASALDELAHRLAMLEEARHELTEVERGAGIQRPSPYDDPTHVPAEPVRAEVPKVVSRLTKPSRGQAQPG